MPRWNLRSMWELAFLLNFFHVFRPLLKINVEFSAEEFETALLNPNDTLSDIHIPLLKATPPITRMALTRDNWQDDIRSYIDLDHSLKSGVHLLLFRKDRSGGDSHGVNFWYEDDSLIGHRLFVSRNKESRGGEGQNKRFQYSS